MKYLDKCASELRAGGCTTPYVALGRMLMAYIAKKLGPVRGKL